MALRGWRLVGVAGTISVYVTGILLLSLMSLQHPETRRSRGGRLYQEVDTLRHHELGIINRKPPLQWCTPLQYLNNKKTIQPVKPTIRLQTFPAIFNTLSGHFVTNHKQTVSKPIKYNIKNNIIDRHSSERNSKISAKDKTVYDDSFKTSKERFEMEKYNEAYKLVSEPWPSGGSEQGSTSTKHKSNIKLRNNLDENGNVVDLTALVSFPGSGNTWLRYLLQQATGILTGSVYKDYGLLKSGFPAENISNSSVLVIKTHEWGTNAWTLFTKAILLVRDPKKAILAEFNRQSGGHVGFASPDRYKRTKGRYWNQFVTNKLWAWEQTNLAWGKNFTGDLHVVFYDKLVDDVEGNLREILKFINFPPNEDLIQCALLRQEGIYRRKKRIMPFDPYTPAMHAIIDKKRREVYDVLGRKT